MSKTPDIAVDFYKIDTDNPQNWFGYTDANASASANLLNVDSNYLPFHPNGLDVKKWIKGLIGQNLTFSNTTLNGWISQNLSEYGIPILKTKSTVNKNGALKVTIYLATGDQVTGVF